MLNLGQEFMRAIARKSGYLIAALAIAFILSLFGTGSASAQTPGVSCTDPTRGWGWPPQPDNQPICPDEGSALTNVQAAVLAQAKAMRPSTTPTNLRLVAINCSPGPAEYCSTSWRVTANGDWTAYRWWPNGNDCLSRNASLGGVNQPVRWASSNAARCLDGCKYEIVDNAQTRKVYAKAPGQVGLVTSIEHGGRWEYTGVCPSLENNEDKGKATEPPKTSCVPAGNGQTFCTLPDGGQCHTASTGRTICWSMNERGTKTDGTSTQTNADGNPPIPTIDGSSNTSSTSITHTTTTTTNVNTINNYSTNNGAPAGTTNQGTAAGPDGSPSGSSNNPGGTGGGDGNEPNTSAGGATCESQPVSSGDQILGQIAIQTWHTRCNAEKGKLTGTGECTEHGTVVGFACSGDPVGCKQASEAKEANCKTWAKDKNGNGQPDWTEGERPTDDAEGNGDAPSIKTNSYGVGNLNTTDIFGGGSCPQFSITIYGVTSSTADIPAWCSIVSIMRAVVLLMAAYAAARILMGGT